jgi:hypothetical protein
VRGVLGGAAQDAWVCAPPICWASMVPSPERPGKAGRGGQCPGPRDAVMPTLSLWLLPFPAISRGRGLLFELSLVRLCCARPFSGTSQGRQRRVLRPRPPKGGVMGHAYARAEPAVLRFAWPPPAG